MGASDRRGRTQVGEPSPPVLPRSAWRARVGEMLRALDAIERYTARIDFEEYRASPMAIDAVLHRLACVGEAAREVPDELTEQYPLIDWVQLRSLPSLVLHQRYGSDPSLVWHLVRHELPLLRPRLLDMLLCDV